MMRSHMYGFPKITLEPGAEESATVAITGLFRAQKLMMVGSMDEVRGTFKIKRTRMPQLDRNDVAGYSRVYRGRRGKKIWFRRGRTTIEFKGNDEINPFTRTYLPESVVYENTDPLSYIALKQLFCGTEAAMPNFGDGAPAWMFGVEQFGNELPLPTASASMKIVLKNEGDIQVRVHASILGNGYGP